MTRRRPVPWTRMIPSRHRHLLRAVAVPLVEVQIVIQIQKVSSTTLSRHKEMCFPVKIFWSHRTLVQTKWFALKVRSLADNVAFHD